MIIFVPIIAAVIILFIPKEQKDLIRGIAFMAAAIVLGLGAVRLPELQRSGQQPE